MFPLDFYGTHFTFTLPNDPSVIVTGADFTLFGRGPNSQFAVGPSLPDSDNACLLFSTAVIVLLGIRRFILARNQ
jgi:hypothetical protein